MDIGNGCNLAEYAHSFEVRVGEDGGDLGNNPVFFHQIKRMDAVLANFTCSSARFGDWISVNKSSPNFNDGNLILLEVRVFMYIIKYGYYKA